LKELGLGTVGDLRSAGKARLVDLLGVHGEDLWDRAHARDDRPVQPDRQAKSISHEQTFSEDLRAADQVRTVLLGLCERVGFRLRRHGLLAGGVSVKIRFGDFQTVSRGRSLGDQPTDLTDELWREARALFDTWASAGFRPVRLIGVGATHLRDRGQQLELFPDPQRRKRAQVDGLVDAVTERFGKGAIRRGGPR
jgi:DNA polymerase-4